MQDFRAVNRAQWDERAPAHAASPGYALDKFRADSSYLSDVVRFDLPRLGDISGLRGVHLQCHIGTDTISLARLGARMTGLDFSPFAIGEARALSEQTAAGVEFVESDLYDAADALGAESFDLVFTGIGALCWLPDVRGWARVVANLLKPGGRLFIREGHPVLWAIDEKRDELVLDYPYFETEEPVVLLSEGTYVETDVEFTANTTITWNHGLGEIVGAILAAGLSLTMLEEHDSVPWEGLPGKMREGRDGEWRLTDRPERLPLSYTLQAVKL
jgi:SAM-dependent methyltransferase